MNGEIAQLVALTCYGNAMLRGISAPPFFPDNSTCRFAEYVKFRDFDRRVELAATPDQWFVGLLSQGTKGLVLRHAPSRTEVDDRMTAGFAGGGATWALEAAKADGTSDFWVAEWDVGDQAAPDDRIWRVDYLRHSGGATTPHGLRTLSAVQADFATALRDIRAFSVRFAGNEGFTSCFDSGLEALRASDAQPGYHRDLYPSHMLPQTAPSLLSAAMVAWVFGGMGSWNDQGFDEEQAEYERVSDALYSIINEAIAVAASSSWPGSGITD